MKIRPLPLPISFGGASPPWKLQASETKSLLQFDITTKSIIG